MVSRDPSRIATVDSSASPGPESFDSNSAPSRTIKSARLSRSPQILFTRPETLKFDAISARFGEEVAPNPPPPRYAFFVAAARALVSRAELLQEIVDATPREGTSRALL